MTQKKNRAGTAIGAVHVVVSCLRVVAFMYNRQQKWLYEQRLPDLVLLRRLLGLGPRSAGEDVSRRGGKSRVLSCGVVLYCGHGSCAGGQDGCVWVFLV